MTSTYFLQTLPSCAIFSPVMQMKNKLRGILALMIAVIIWGSAFIAQSVGMDHIGPMTFQTVRSALAVLFMAPLTFLFSNNQAATVRNWRDPKLWKAGILCGMSLFIAGGLQQVGLVYTSAGKAGFITAMYIVLVPVLGIFLKKRPSPAAWLSVAVAVSGLYLLSCVGVSEINKGDLLLLGCAMAFSVQITLVDRHACDLDGIQLNCVQTLVCSLLSAAAMFLTENPEIGSILQCWLPLCYAGILSMGVAYTLQIVGQRYLEPTPASLIMSLESVYAVLFAWLILDERMAPHELLGCGLVFVAVIISQIPAKRKTHD